MLKLVLPATDELEAVEIHLEHSLASLSKWESIHEKAFFAINGEEKTQEETDDYIRQMLVKPELPPSFVHRLVREHYDTIGEYINKRQTATTFHNIEQSKGRQEPITAELIYYWMIGFQIPFSPCEDWPFNRLMTLIRVAGIKQTKPKRMPRAQQIEEMKRLNAERRQRLGTNG
jgi:hypothetical protein